MQIKRTLRPLEGTEKGAFKPLRRKGMLLGVEDRKFCS